MRPNFRISCTVLTFVDKVSDLTGFIFLTGTQALPPNVCLLRELTDQTRLSPLQLRWLFVLLLLQKDYLQCFWPWAFLVVHQQLSTW